MTRNAVALLYLLAFLVLITGCVVEVNDSAAAQKPAPTAAPAPEKIEKPVDTTPKRAWEPRKTPPVELPKEPEPAPTPQPPATPTPEPTPAPAPTPTVDANQTEPGLNGKPVPKEFNVDLAMGASTPKYTPEQITVAEGDLVELHLKSNSDGLGQGVGYKAEGLPIDVILKKGQTQTVEFTASQAGTYPVTCGYPCGPGNAGKAFGKIEVVGGN